MKTVFWIYFLAVSLVGMAMAIAIPWVGQIMHHCFPGAHFPAPTQLVLDHSPVLYAVPLPSLCFALRVPADERLLVVRLHLVGAYSLLACVLTLCVPLLALLLPFLPLCVMMPVK
ncbi:MAG: hypothetical protein IPL39_09445 [Opitutaceae bacterium]|nr:hypothetical protein [Opitutaceae bacterium]